MLGCFPFDDANGKFLCQEDEERVTRQAQNYDEIYAKGVAQELEAL